MSDNLQIKITGANQSSAAFQQVTRDATQMGSAVEQSGQKATRSLIDLSAKSALVGAAIGSATLVLGEWSRAAAEDAAAQSRLQQSIENTGKSYDEYSDAVDKAIKAGQDKAYSDDATREVLVRLNAVTNDTGQSLDQLSLAMDFARARGISLADSAGIIAKVYGGNLGILTRYGIVLEEGATATEALAKIQQISAGQADTYANSQLGWLDKQKDKWGELTETIGASTGELQQFLLLLPGLSAGATALSGLVAGMGGISGLATLLGPAGLLLGGLEAYRTYQGQGLAATGNSPELSLWNSFFGGASSAANMILPGSPFDSSRYSTAGDANDVEDVLKSLFFIDPVATGTGDKDYAKALYDRLITFGVIPQSQYTDSQTGRDEQLDIIKSKAASSGLTLDQFILSYLNAPGGTAVYDPVSQKYMDKGEYQIYTTQRTQLRSDQIAAGATSYVGSPGTSGLAGAVPKSTDPYNGMGIYNPFYQIPSNAPITADNPYYSGPGPAYAQGGSGAVANSLSGVGAAPIVLSEANQAAADAANIQAQTDALIAQYPAWQNIITGINNANDAQSAFQATQGGLMGEMDVYSQQQSEYSGQLSAMEEAHNLLNQRVAEGIPLTKEQQEFQENYNAALEIGTGAVEDTVLAQGTLAQQLLLNKGTMDEYKTANQESVAATGELKDAVLLLIETLGGVPDDVRTKITLDGEAELHAALNAAVNHLNNVNGQTATFYINTQQTGVAIGNPNGPSIDNNYLGGVVGYRNGGIPVELAEAGPELLHFRNGGQAWAMNRGVYNVPRGTYVDTAPASRLKAGSGGGVNNFYGSVTVIANNPQQFMDAMRESNIGGSRS